MKSEQVHYLAPRMIKTQSGKTEVGFYDQDNTCFGSVELTTLEASSVMQNSIYLMSIIVGTIIRLNSDDDTSHRVLVVDSSLFPDELAGLLY